MKSLLTCHSDFPAFRVLWNSVPFTEESANLIMDCLNWYVKRSGKSMWVIERVLALYKLNMEVSER